ncbi:MAG: glycosyltransferase [Rubrivivax sp.]|nr:MAG: glycosyltransferase [Rubrivivax sp.]
MNVIYISYDGLMEPLGQSQVLRYLEGLAERHLICLITFEKPADWQQVERREQLVQKVRAAGIHWVPLRYHKRPTAIATSFDICQGLMAGLYLALRFRARIAHARGYVPSVIALGLKNILGLRYVFDMRGFWADERVDGGLWPAGARLYRVAKWFERRFLLNADQVVSLTRAAVDIIQDFPYLQGRPLNFAVITTCTDLNLFQPGLEASRHEADRPFTVGYVGSVGVWYMFDETLVAFKFLKEQVPSAVLRILNRDEHAFIRERLAFHGIDPAGVSIQSADYFGVAAAMRQMDVGIFFIKPAFSKIASAPTKLGEFLGCGVPCLGNAGVGDMGGILNGEAVGVAVTSFEGQALKAGVMRLLELRRHPDIARRCRAAALKHFSLTGGIQAYDEIYARLGASSS